MRAAYALLSVLLLASSLATAQAQNLVSNGGFEVIHNGKTGAALSTDTTNYRIAASKGLDGWTSTSSISLLLGAGHGDDPTRNTLDPDTGLSWNFRLAGPANGFNNGLAAASPVGGNYMAVDGTDGGQGTLSQTVNGLIIGQSYKLSFWWGAGTLNTAYSNYNSSIGWNVSVKGAGIPADLTASLRTGNYTKEGTQPPWTEAIYLFTASATSEVMSFSTNGFATGHPPMALLDGVSITAVPESSTWLMMGLGLACLMVVRRRLPRG